MKLSVLIELINRTVPVRFYAPDISDLTFCYLDEAENNHVIMTNEGTAVELYCGAKGHWGTCIVTDPCPAITQTVFECIDRYRSWREECLRKAASAASVSEVLETCASLLSNPIALFDESLVMSAYAGKMPDSVEGTIWEDILESGISRPEMYSAEEADIIAKALKNSRKPFVWKSVLFHGKMHLSTNVYRNDTPAGVLGQADLRGAGFSEGDVQLAEDTADFISLFYSRMNSDPGNVTNLYYIERMLNGLSVNETQLAKSIEPLGWKLRGSYQVFCLSRGTANEYANTSYQKRVQKLFPDDIVLIHEDHLVLLSVHSESSGEYVKILHDTFGFACGLSLPFSDLNHLYYSYIQSRISLSCAKENETVCFNEVYRTYILESIAKLTEIKALCHPKILEMYESNDPGSLTLIDNLRVYLLSGRNIAESSRTLFLHRNTLIYRLARLDEILGVKLAEIPESEVFLYLFSCMIIQSL